MFSVAYKFGGFAGGPRPGSATLDTLPTDKFHARLIDRLVRARFSFF
jgi:hypothetical protein